MQQSNGAMFIPSQSPMFGRVPKSSTAFCRRELGLQQFGLLGQRWRVRRSLVSASIVAGALCLEPLARWAAGRLMPPAPVWTVEVTSGAVVAALFVYALLDSRRAGRVSSP